MTIGLGQRQRIYDTMAVPEIYTREYYARIAELEHRHWWHLGMQDIAYALLGGPHRKQFGRVLDAGCGAGAMMVWAARKLGSNDVRGVDIAPEAVAFCTRQNPQWPVAVASVLDLPYPDGSFDLVLSNDVVQHLPIDGGDARGVREMARVLAPGGVLLLRTNSRVGMWQRADARDHDYQRYVLMEVRELLESAGLTVSRASYVNMLGSAHESLRRLVRRRDRRVGPCDSTGRPPHGHTDRHRTLYEGLQMRDTASKWPLLNRLLTLTLQAEAAVLSRPGRSLPFGHSIVAVAVKR